MKAKWTRRLKCYGLLLPSGELHMLASGWPAIYKRSGAFRMRQAKCPDAEVVAVTVTLEYERAGKRKARKVK